MAANKGEWQREVPVSGTLYCQWQLSYEKARNCMADSLPSAPIACGIFHASPVADSAARAPFLLPLSRMSLVLKL